MTITVEIEVGEQPPMVSDLHWALHLERITNYARCIDHTYSGPEGSGFVFATCSKCQGRAKVRIES